MGAKFWGWYKVSDRGGGTKKKRSIGREEKAGPSEVLRGGIGLRRVTSGAEGMRFLKNGGVTLLRKRGFKYYQ